MTFTAGRLPSEGNADKRGRALLILSGLVGATNLSRAVSDPILSRKILDQVRQQLLGLMTGNALSKHRTGFSENLCDASQCFVGRSKNHAGTDAACKQQTDAARIRTGLDAGEACSSEKGGRNDPARRRNRSCSFVFHAEEVAARK